MSREERDEGIRSLLTGTLFHKTIISVHTYMYTYMYTVRVHTFWSADVKKYMYM